ncbi:MAG: trypsin-like peptidase domain-containing protein [Acholeplasmataceae bacterium]|nr:trypsin-like peptidase domain-containing protein [Acholeplasmataceae bacterium]
MKKMIIFVILILILTGCQQVDTEKLKQEIKDELQDELVFDINDLNEYLQEVSSYASSCTISIEVSLEESTIHGSGFVYKKEGNDYYILTNEHIVRYYQSIEIYSPQNEHYIQASIEKVDAHKDLAILTMTTTDLIGICEIRQTDYKVGEFVLAIGSPLELSYSNTITLGIISRLDETYIQHDASVNIGNSGGPLFNLKKEIIGLNVSKINTTSASGSTVSVEGIGFAIPLEHLINFIT